MVYNARMDGTDLQEPSLRALDANAESSESLLSRIFSSQPNKAGVIAGSIGFLFVIAYLDWLTSPEIHLPLLYIIPGAMVTWFVGRRAGFSVSLLSAFVQLGAEVIRTDVYTHPSRAYWNTGSRLIFYTLLVILISAMRQLSTRLGAMVNARTHALRRLAWQLSDAEDSERRRLVNDIHDSLSQTLSLLKLSLSAALAEQAGDASSRQRIEGALATVNELIQKTRTLMFDLYPAMLEHLGLGQTLRHYSEEFGRQTGIEVTVNEEGQPQMPSRTMVNYLFRSAKELVNNAAKHGNAREIVLSLHWMPATLRVVVDDDGAGFDPMQTFMPDETKGLGLAAIRERLRSLGGSVRIESSPGKGARVVLEAPLAAREVAA
jgi:signal transduction histidine kinase